MDFNQNQNYDQLFERDLIEIKERLDEDLDILGKPVYDSPGLLAEHEFCRIYKLIQKYVIKVPTMRLLIQQRRQLFKDQEKEEEYG